MKPIGTTAQYWQGRTDWGVLPPEATQGIEIVSEPYQPSIEKLLILKPDLLIGLTLIEQYYPQLDAIAPTVILDASQPFEVSSKAHLRAIAQVVGKEAKAEEILDRYQQRIAALRAQLNGRLEGKEVSVICYGDGNFFTLLGHREPYFQV